MTSSNLLAPSPTSVISKGGLASLIQWREWGFSFCEPWRASLSEGRLPRRVYFS